MPQYATRMTDCDSDNGAAVSRDVSSLILVRIHTFRRILVMPSSG